MALRPTELPALGVFAVAARHQNFAHAADELHLTASAVSHHVRRLEASLGIALFQRHARGVVLTAEGRALADSANGAFADLAAVSAALRRRARDVEHEIVRVTTLHSLAYCWLLPRLPRFAALHPRIKLDVETSHALARFDESGPDLAIRHGAGQWPGLSSVHLMDEQLFPVAAPTLPGLAAVRTAAEVANLPLITDRAHQGWRDWFLAAGVRAVRLPPMHSFADSTDAMRAAAVGLGAALARTAIAAPYLASGELVRLPGPALAARFAYWLVHPAHRRPRAATAAFVAWLRREAPAPAPSPAPVSAVAPASAPVAHTDAPSVGELVSQWPTLIGIDRDASIEQIEAAYATRRRELDAARYAPAADETQRAQAARALRRLDAAYEVVRAARAR